MRPFVVPCGVCVDESEFTAINHLKNQLQSAGCDDKIQLLTDLQEALSDQTKGLMQRLLPGKVRVPESILKKVTTTTTKDAAHAHE